METYAREQLEMSIQYLCRSVIIGLAALLMHYIYSTYRLSTPTVHPGDLG